MSIHLHTNNLGTPETGDHQKLAGLPADVTARPKAEVDWQRQDERQTKTIRLPRTCSIQLIWRTSWRDFQSGVKDVVDYVNQVDHVS